MIECGRITNDWGTRRWFWRGKNRFRFSVGLQWFWITLYRYADKRAR